MTPRSRHRATLAAAAAVALLAGLACSRGGGGGGSGGEAGAPTASGTWRPPSDYAGQRVCDAVKAITGDPSLASPGPLIEAGGDGASSTHPLLAVASQAMANAARRVLETPQTAQTTQSAQPSPSASPDPESPRAQLGTRVKVVAAVCEGAGYYPPA